MKKTLLAIFMVCISVLANAQNEDAQISTFYFIRHAEKEFTGDNPHLTNEGLARVEQWKTILSEVKFDAVYSTNTYRTLETAMPIALANDLKITTYDTKTFNTNTFRYTHVNKNILIVGHSNTIPKLVSELAKAASYNMIDENDYGQLYIVTVINGVADVKLLHFN